MLDQLSWFLPAFFKGLGVNFQLAFWVLLGGLPMGLLLAFLRLGTGWTARLTGWLITLLRAVPTSVVMVFLVKVLPGNFSVIGIGMAMTPKAAIVLALIIYVTGLCGGQRPGRPAPVAHWLNRSCAAVFD